MNNNFFQSLTKLPERTVVVSHLPNVVDSQNPIPTESTHVNVPEMDELSNTQNPFLYRVQCGCLVKLPVTIAPRREPTNNERGQFLQMTYSGGVPESWPSGNLESRLSLDYVRDFCGCDGPLKGFGFRDRLVQNGRLGQFAIRAV